MSVADLNSRSVDTTMEALSPSNLAHYLRNLDKLGGEKQQKLSQVDREIDSLMKQRDAIERQMYVIDCRKRAVRSAIRVLEDNEN